MKVEIIIANKTKNKIALKSTKVLVEKVIKRVVKTDLVFLSITFVGTKLIKKINTKVFSKKYSTDVISLEIGSKNEVAGDIYICVDVANKNAKKFNVSLSEELKRLVIHGVLHSIGMEHKNADSDSKMIALQERLIKEFADLKIL